MTENEEFFNKGKKFNQNNILNDKELEFHKNFFNENLKIFKKWKKNEDNLFVINNKLQNNTISSIFGGILNIIKRENGYILISSTRLFIILKPNEENDKLFFKYFCNTENQINKALQRSELCDFKIQYFDPKQKIYFNSGKGDKIYILYYVLRIM